jgi:hypothetical protein
MSKLRQQKKTNLFLKFEIERYFQQQQNPLALILPFYAYFSIQY